MDQSLYMQFAAVPQRPSTSFALVVRRFVLPEQDLWQCNVDRLTVMVMDITNWVCDVILLCPHHERILGTVEWMEPKD